MLGVNSRSDFRRASLVSEIYSEETHAAPTSAPPVVTAPGGPGGTGSGIVGSGNGAQTKLPAPIRPPPVMPGMVRKVPKGKFGLIGLGEVISVPASREMPFEFCYILFSDLWILKLQSNF